jgi:hypothetical protein
MEINTGDNRHERIAFTFDSPFRCRRLLAHGATRPLHQPNPPVMTGLSTADRLQMAACRANQRVMTVV